MRNTTLKIMLLALLLMTLSGYGVGEPTPDQGTMNGMTVAQLEKAGDEARAVKDYTLAIQYFQTALSKDRKNAVLYNKLGLSELRKDDLAGARMHFERAIKQNSKYAEAVN